MIHNVFKIWGILIIIGLGVILLSNFSHLTSRTIRSFIKFILPEQVSGSCPNYHTTTKDNSGEAANGYLLRCCLFPLAMLQAQATASVKQFRFTYGKKGSSVSLLSFLRNKHLSAYCS